MRTHSDYEYRKQPGFDMKTFKGASQAIPMKTLVIHCFDPRAVEIPQAVAEYLGDEVYPGEIIPDKNGTRVGSTRTLFAATNAGGRAAFALESVAAMDYIPSGRGPMWDFAEDKHSIKLIESFLAAGKPIGIVCHSTGALHHVKTPDGKPLVQGKEVTGFTNGEEADVGLTKVGALPCRRRDAEPGRCFLENRKLGSSRCQRRLADHGTEPSFLGSSREDADRDAQQESETGGARFVNRNNNRS